MPIVANFWQFDILTVFTKASTMSKLRKGQVSPSVGPHVLEWWLVKAPALHKGLNYLVNCTTSTASSLESRLLEKAYGNTRDSETVDVGPFPKGTSF